MNENEVGVPAPALNTTHRSLCRYQERDVRDQFASAAVASSARTSGHAALVMYDVTALHFEITAEDELRRVGMSKEHHVDPQVLAGC